jgi:hypothetical protein
MSGQADWWPLAVGSWPFGDRGQAIAGSGDYATVIDSSR